MSHTRSRNPGGHDGSLLPGVPPEAEPSFTLASWDQILAWARQRSLRPVFFGSACCTLTGRGAEASNYAVTALGEEAMWTNPEQADLLIVSGPVTQKVAPTLLGIYEQMAEPTHVIALGACAISGGPYERGYHVVPGVDRLIPVDVYVTGCPPRPASLWRAISALPAYHDPPSLNDTDKLHPDEASRAAGSSLKPKSLADQELHSASRTLVDDE